MSDHVKYEALVISLSNKWVYKLARNSIYTRQDLISEGWIVYMKCKDKPIERAKFSTYLTTAIINRFKQINVEERDRYKVKGITLSADDEDNDITLTQDTNKSPERMAMVSEAISAISEVSVDFARMVIDGAPKELMAIARRSMRAKRFSKRAKFNEVSISLIFTKDMLENFFDIDLEFLRKLLSNYI